MNRYWTVTLVASLLVGGLIYGAVIALKVGLLAFAFLLLTLAIIISLGVAY